MMGKKANGIAFGGLLALRASGKCFAAIERGWLLTLEFGQAFRHSVEPVEGAAEPASYSIH